MGRRSYSRNRRTEERWRAAGRGQGERTEYQPWLTGHDVASDGTTYQPLGWHIERQYELLSTWEYYYFLHLEWSWTTHHDIWDIREQFPLPWVDDTVALAERLGIVHPRDRHSGEPLTMTTDFMITRVAGVGPGRLIARTFKPATKLRTDRRTLEKLEIERQYYREREIDWGVVTEDQLCLALAHNMEFLRDARPYAIDGLPVSQEPDVADTIRGALVNADEGFSATCLTVDRRLGLALGTSLAVLKHEIAIGRWRVNMFEELDPAAPLIVAAAMEESADQGAS